jgi:hypothetical protein
MEWEDFYQEGYAAYLNCVRVYADQELEDKHFMALFKTAIFRMICKHAFEDSGSREHIISVSDPALKGQENEGDFEIVDETPERRMFARILISEMYSETGKRQFKKRA